MIENSKENIIQILGEFVSRDDTVIDIKIEELKIVSFNKIYRISYKCEQNGAIQKKMYIIKVFLGSRGLQNCIKEFEIIKRLNQISNIIPKVFTYKINSKIVKDPYIVMEYLGNESLERCIFNSNNILKKYKLLKLYVELMNDIHSIDSTFVCDVFNIDKSELRNISVEQLISEKLKNAKDICMNYELKGFEDIVDWLLYKLNSIEWINSRPCLIHQDFHLNNIMVNDGLPHVIDWSDSEIGDFRSDIAKIIMYYDKDVTDIILNKYESIANIEICSIKYFVILESFFTLFRAYLNVKHNEGSVDSYTVKKCKYYEKYYENLYVTIKNTLNLDIIPEVEMLMCNLNR